MWKAFTSILYVYVVFFHHVHYKLMWKAFTSIATLYKFTKYEVLDTSTGHNQLGWHNLSVLQP